MAKVQRQVLWRIPGLPGPLPLSRVQDLVLTVKSVAGCTVLAFFSPKFAAGLKLRVKALVVFYCCCRVSASIPVLSLGTAPRYGTVAQDGPFCLFPPSFFPNLNVL